MSESSPTDGAEANATPEPCRLAATSRTLGRLGLLAAAVTLPAVIVTEKLDWPRVGTVALSGLVLTAALALAAIVSGSAAKVTMGRAPWPLQGRASANDGIRWGLICFLALVLNFFVVPFFVASRSAEPVSACHAHLYQMERARQQWLREKIRASSDTMSWEDIVGPRKAFMVVPQCPANGTYTLGGTTSRPTCTVEWHILR